MNIKKLLASKSVKVSYLTTEIDKTGVKEFREKFGLSQTALANVMGVSKKAVEKWEQGINRVSKSAAVLFAVINECPEVLNIIRKVNLNIIRKVKVKDSRGKEFDYNNVYKTDIRIDEAKVREKEAKFNMFDCNYAVA